jgi:hypothetical protein
MIRYELKTMMRAFILNSRIPDGIPPARQWIGIATLDGSLRERFFWYNIEPEFGAHSRDFNPLLDERKNKLVATLDIELDTLAMNPRTWTGVMHGYDGCGLDVSGHPYLEIWVNDFKPDPADRGGRLYIDVGRIDEDFFEPHENRFDDEDKNKDGFTASTEDTGLDGLFNKDGDVSDDDFSCYRDSYGRFTHINGTEANLRHDTEDLNRSGILDTENCYLEYSIALTDTALQDIRRDFPEYEGFLEPGHEFDSWRKYVIDLSSGIEMDGNCWSPCDILKSSQHIRVWFQNTAEVTNPNLRRLQVAYLRFVKQ